jgi:ketosteroid isomerase-like protein
VSQENGEAFKRAIEAYNRRDVEALLRDLDEVLAERQIHFSEIRDVGDHVVATGSLRIRGKNSGALSESPFGCVAELKNGKAIRIETYLDPSEALEHLDRVS